MAVSLAFAGLMKMANLKCTTELIPLKEFLMRTVQRRDFLGAALTGAALLTSQGKAAFAFQGQSSPRARSADSRVEILLNEPVGKISPDIYGHFVEHLGGVVYDGIWVGEDSKIPNVNGIRKELVDHMKRISPSVV